MKFRLLLASMLMFFLVGCAPYWQKYNPEMLMDTPDVKIFSMAPNDYRPGDGMNQIETAPAKLPANLFDDLATLSERVGFFKWDFAFVKDFKPEWKAQIEKGIAKKGNSIIAFGSGDNDYVAFDAPSIKGRGKELDDLKSIPFVSGPKDLAKLVETIDSKGEKQLMGAFDRKSGGGVMILYDAKQVDYLWMDMKEVHRKTFMK